MNRPITTLFMLMSVDGKISTGATDDFDFDQDIPSIPCTCDGIFQYYALEKQTDEWSLCSGKTQHKLGLDKRTTPEKTNVNFVIVDNYHLTAADIHYLALKAKRLFIVTSNPEHPCNKATESNIVTIYYQTRVNLTDMLKTLYDKYGCTSLTIQSGGTLNKAFFDAGLIDVVDIVVAPIIVGGSHTPTLIDGVDNTDIRGIINHGNLRLMHCTPLEHHYVHLRYEVRHIG